MVLSPKSDPVLSNLRFQNRIELLKFEAITIEFGYEGDFIKSIVKNITAFGALIQMEEFEWKKLGTGTKIKKIKILFNQVEIGCYQIGSICHKKLLNKEYLVGVMFGDRILTSEQKAGLFQEKRKNSRVIIDEKFAPYAWAFHPVDYDQVIHFRVLDISIGGAKLSCSARNTMIFSSMEFESLEFLLPTVGAAKMKIRVVQVDSDSDSNQLILNTVFINKNKDFEKKISKYLLCFGKKSEKKLISEIRSSGLKIKQIKTYIDFDYVRNEKDYSEVLNLRKQAYGREGKIPGHTRAEDMADIFDLNSIIIIAKHQETVIGSVRVTYCKDSTDRYELEDSIVVPNEFKRSETIEISRLCVSDDFQGTDVVHGLIERCTEVGFKLGIKRVITSCVASMLDYYAKIGFFQKGKAFYLKTLNNLPHYFLVHNTQTSLKSTNLNPVYWFFSYSNIVKHLSKYNVVSEPELSKLNKIYLKAGLKIFRMKQSIVVKSRTG